MPRDHFSKVMHSPYFRTEAYKQSGGGKLETQIENFFKKLFRRGKK
jgi:hypothetical protein